MKKIPALSYSQELRIAISVALVGAALVFGVELAKASDGTGQTETTRIPEASNNGDEQFDCSYNTVLNLMPEYRCVQGYNEIRNALYERRTINPDGTTSTAFIPVSAFSNGVSNCDIGAIHYQEDWVNCKIDVSYTQPRITPVASVGANDPRFCGCVFRSNVCPGGLEPRCITAPEFSSPNDFWGNIQGPNQYLNYAFEEFQIAGSAPTDQNFWAMYANSGGLVSKFPYGRDFMMRLLGWVDSDNSEFCGCQRVPGQGCFAPGTQILLSDRESTKAAEEIVSGDILWNPVEQKAVKVTRVIHSAEKDPFIRLGFDNSVVTVSQTHPVLTSVGPKKARELKLGDLVAASSGGFKPLTILDILPVEEGQWVINFEFEKDVEEKFEYIVADGIIAGDITLQTLLNTH